MRILRSIGLATLLAAALAFVPTAAHAQVAVGIGIGPVVGYPAPVYVAGPPVCTWGYYSYYPYACAPYGYWGPDWFVGGVFIGAGPWYRGWYGYPWGWGYGHIGWYGWRGGYYGYRGGYNGARPAPYYNRSGFGATNSYRGTAAYNGFRGSSSYGLRGATPYSGFRGSTSYGGYHGYSGGTSAYRGGTSAYRGGGGSAGFHGGGGGGFHGGGGHR